MVDWGRSNNVNESATSTLNECYTYEDMNGEECWGENLVLVKLD